jgi:hypothetical protein
MEDTRNRTVTQRSKIDEPSKFQSIESEADSIGRDDPAVVVPNSHRMAARNRRERISHRRKKMKWAEAAKEGLSYAVQFPQPTEFTK